MRRCILAILCLLAAATTGGSPAGGQNAPQKAAPKAAPAAPTVEQLQSATPGVPDAATLLALIRTTLIAVDQANRTGNYTVLRDIGSPTFQAKNSAAHLGIAFAKLRAANLDLTPIAIVTPKATQPPSITEEGLLRIVGNFPTRPIQINFQLVFQLIGGKWRIYAISVGTQRADAAQPAAAAPGAAAGAKGAKK